jgi:hypothetical protein
MDQPLKELDKKPYAILHTVHLTKMPDLEFPDFNLLSPLHPDCGQ